MMKKLLVLSLVLAVSAMSSAALSLVAEGGVVSVVSSDTLAWDGYLVFTPGLPLENISLTPAGDKSLSAITPWGLQGWWDFGYPAIGTADTYNIVVAGAPGAEPEIGVQAIALFDVIGFGDVDMGMGSVSLIPAFGAQVASTLYAIPEPMTMGLLGLGALFLRRRK